MKRLLTVAIMLAAVTLSATCKGKSSPAAPTGSSQQDTPSPQPGTQTFLSSSPIRIPSTGTSGPADPYPSTINVTGMGGNITKVMVTISTFTHTFPDDVALLLVGPQGQGGRTTVLTFNTGCGFAIVNVTLTFDQAAAEPLPDETQIVSGTYRPTGVDVSGLLTPPAPAPPFSLTLDAFNGTSANGTWSLFVYDDSNDDVGRIEGGWSLTITTGLPATSGSVSAASTREAPLGGPIAAISDCAPEK